MGYPVIKQPDGQYAIFSTFSDILMGFNMTRQEVIDWYVALAKQRAEEETKQCLDEIDKGRKICSKSFKQALRRHVEMEGNCEDEELNKAVRDEIKKHKEK